VQAGDRLLQPFPTDGFEQIIQRVHLKGADGILVERRDKDDAGRDSGALQQFKAGSARHLNIEENDVRLGFLHQGHRLIDIRSLSDERQLFELGEHEPQL